MNWTTALSLILGSTAMSAASVALARWDALRRHVLDIPNARSSHVAPTPRGGGIGIVVTVLAGLAASGGPAMTRWLIAAALTAVAIVGWIDDHRSLPPLPRLIAHIAAGGCIALVARSFGIELLPRLGGAVAFAWWIFWTVSAVNVTNFMDGIDGIIGLQLLVFASFAALALSGEEWSTRLALVTVGASLGFLVFNWAPARIFLGDVGSGAIGVLLVALGVLIVGRRGWTIVHAFLPLLPLFADEAITKARRIRNGERLTEAHQAHVYQRLVQAGWSHRSVSLLYGAAAALCGSWVFAFPRHSAAFLAGAVALVLGVVGAMLAMRSYAERAIRY